MDNRQTIKNRMLNVIRGQAMYVKEDTFLSDEDKLEQVNILLDIMQYVQHQTEYSQVIAEHKRKKQRLLGKEQEVTE